jgi:hypothetical protein
MITFGLAQETHLLDTDVYLMAGDSVIFNGAESLPATRWGVLDMYRTKMLCELYKFTNDFQIVFKE